MVVYVLIFILIIITAVLLCMRRPPCVQGGAEDDDHVLGRALYDHTRSFTKADIIGGCDGGASNPVKAPKQLWSEYKTWDDLKKDSGATSAYLAQRAAFINNPNLNWSKVITEIIPKLDENREYIGIINVGNDKKTLYVTACEASPIIAGEMKSETAFAGIPSTLVNKYANKPGLIIFHTHPADIRGSPLPSSHDISTAIYLCATARYAANVVISRYGVLAFGLDWDALDALNAAKNWKLALLNLSHDAVAAHESIRSWSAYKLQDYFDFYAKYRMFIFLFPTAEMVGDSRRYTFKWSLENIIDHEIINDHMQEIHEHRKKGKKTSSLKMVYD